MQLKDYDEEAVLTHYLLCHYSHLMTPVEWMAQKTLCTRDKAANCENPEHGRRLLQRMGHEGNEQVLAILAHGPEAFRRGVRERLMSEHGDEIYVHRCPDCRRIVRTPKAQQCFWCGHDWHPRND